MPHIFLVLISYADLGRGPKARIQLYDCSVPDPVVRKICLSLRPVLDPPLLTLLPWSFQCNEHLEQAFASHRLLINQFHTSTSIDLFVNESCRFPNTSWCPGYGSSMTWRLERMSALCGTYSVPLHRLVRIYLFESNLITKVMKIISFFSMDCLDSSRGRCVN
jgi:hypothetical protein